MTDSVHSPFPDPTAAPDRYSPDLYQPDREAMPLPALRALQLTQLQQMLALQDARVPAYRERFARAGLTPHDLRSLDDLRVFPFTRKSDLRDHYPLGCAPRPAPSCAAFTPAAAPAASSPSWRTRRTT